MNTELKVAAGFLAVLALAMLYAVAEYLWANRRGRK